MPEAPSSELTLPEPEPEHEAVESVPAPEPDVDELAGPEVELDLAEPELEPEAEAEPEPGPGPEPEPEPELELELELEEPTFDLHGGQAASAASEEEGVQSLLAAKKLEKYAEAMAEQGYSFVDDLFDADGEELAQLAEDLQMKTPEARRFLKAVAARKSAAAETGAGQGTGGGLVEALSCPICFELFGDGVVPRILVGCGHSFFGSCLDKILWPLPARGGRKTLGCPTCRTECDVPRGRATELPVNFLGLQG